MGIMHRDVKPHNVMIDHDNRKVRSFVLRRSRFLPTYMYGTLHFFKTCYACFLCALYFETCLQ